MVTKRIFLNDIEESLLLCGEQDSNLKTLEQRFGVQIFARASTLAVRGNTRKVDQAISSIEKLRENIRSDQTKKFEENFSKDKSNSKSVKVLYPKNLEQPNENVIYTSSSGKMIRPLSPHQKKYVEAISASDMVMAIGPAGTGKTFLAVVCALRELHAGRAGRIVLTRPVVEAGEKLGFLPGDFYDKVNPYLKPLYDAFYVLLGPERFRIYREDETVEIVPLAYMRGRTLDNAFVILDEAQNTTPEQMKMFLTRMGSRSKMVITGDVTQIDLDFKQRSGFVHSLKILKNVSEIQFIAFSNEDIVRHPLVRKILHAYDSHEEKT